MFNSKLLVYQRLSWLSVGLWCLPSGNQTWLAGNPTFSNRWFPSQPPLITSCWRSFLKAMGHLIVSPEKCRKIWETLKISGKHPRTTILKTCFYLSWVYYMVTVSGQCFASGWTNNDQGDRKLSEEWVCTPKSISESCWFIWPWPIDGQGNVNNPIFRQTSVSSSTIDIISPLDIHV